MGAIYATIANLPREVAFKRKMTALLAIIPGPREPAHAEFAKILEPIVDDFQRCEKGLLIQSQGRLINVSCRLLLIASDLPAAKKMLGHVSHNSGPHPCHHCTVTTSQLQTPEAYNLESLPPCLWKEKLKAAFEARTASANRRKEIAKAFGVHYTPMLKLIGFNHCWTAPPDPMHNTFLGIARAWFAMIMNSKLFSSQSRALFGAVFQNASYPSHLGRLPQRIVTQMTRDTESSKERRAGASLKADEWKRAMQVLPVALYMGLKDSDDKIPDVELGPMPKPRGRKRKNGGDDQDQEDDETFDDVDPLAQRRNPAEIYRITIFICCALQVLHGRSISVEDAEYATRDLSLAAKNILSMGGTLTINWHTAMHYPEFVKQYGPLSGYSTWAFERNNGALSRVNHNGQAENLPATLMRSWVRENRLMAILHNPAPDADEIEREYLRKMREEKKPIRGTVMLEESRSLRADRIICLPPPRNPEMLVDLHQLDAYDAFINFLQQKHPEVNWRKDSDGGDNSPFTYVPSRSTAYKTYGYVSFNSFR